MMSPVNSRFLSVKSGMVRLMYVYSLSSFTFWNGTLKADYSLTKYIWSSDVSKYSLELLYF